MVPSYPLFHQVSLTQRLAVTNKAEQVSAVFGFALTKSSSLDYSWGFGFLWLDGWVEFDRSRSFAGSANMSKESRSKNHVAESVCRLASRKL